MLLPVFAPTIHQPYVVKFDGTAYLRHNSAVASDSTKFTFFFWARRNVLTQDFVFAIVNNGGAGQDQRLEISFDGVTAPLRIKARNSAGTDILEVDSSNIGDTDWHSYLGSFDLTDTGKRHLYIDNVSDLATVNIYTNDTIELSGGAGPEAYIANREILGVPNLRFNGDMAQFWFDSGTYIDLSIAANRAKFITSLNRPVDLGTTGNFPTGSTPDVFLNGALPGWITNKGTGGGFTEFGTVTAATTRP